MYTYNPNIWEVETGSEACDYPWLHSEFKGGLGHMRPCQKEKKSSSSPVGQNGSVTVEKSVRTWVRVVTQSCMPGLVMVEVWRAKEESQKDNN